MKFTDAELLGMPWILTVSPRSLAAGGVEVTERATGERSTRSIEEVEALLRAPAAERGQPGLALVPHRERVILPKVRDPRFITVRRGGTLEDEDHRLLALWAADCAEHVLHHFEAVTAGRRPTSPGDRARAGLGARGGPVVGGSHGGRSRERRGQGPARRRPACRVRRGPGGGGGPRRGA